MSANRAWTAATATEGENRRVATPRARRTLAGGDVRIIHHGSQYRTGVAQIRFGPRCAGRVAVLVGGNVTGLG